MNKKLLIVYVLLVTTVLFSCRRKNITSSPEKATEEAIANFHVQELDFNYFQSKAKLNFKDGNNDMNANMHLRIKKDETIWMSLTHPLGIEGARILIKPDSIYVHDKINNQRSTFAFDYISQKFNVTLTFQNIQAMLLGNLPVARGENDKLINDEVSGFYQLRQQNGNIFVNNFIRHETMKLEKLDLSDQVSGNALVVNYEDFGVLNNFAFPYRNIILGSVTNAGVKQDVSINIVHNKPEITDKELSFPF